jgi:hypothetical protein
METERNQVDQVEMVCLEQMVPEWRSCRKFGSFLDFDSIDARLAILRKENSNEGYGLPVLFKCLFFQHLEDLNDWELERKGNVVVEWFCGFGLTEAMPDQRIFTGARSRLARSHFWKFSQI